MVKDLLNCLLVNYTAATAWCSMNPLSVHACNHSWLHWNVLNCIMNSLGSFEHPTCELLYDDAAWLFSQNGHFTSLLWMHACIVPTQADLELQRNAWSAAHLTPTLPCNSSLWWITLHCVLLENIFPTDQREGQAYLIFVHSINSGASVKKLTEGNFPPQLTRKGLLTAISHTMCNFTHSVQFYTQCVILHTMCHFTNSV